MERKSEGKKVQLIGNFLYFKDDSTAINVNEIRGIYPESEKKASIRFKNLSNNKAVVTAYVSEIVDAIKGRGRKIS